MSMGRPINEQMKKEWCGEKKEREWHIKFPNKYNQIFFSMRIFRDLKRKCERERRHFYAATNFIIPSNNAIAIEIK